MRLLCKDTQKSISAKKIFNTIHKDTKKEFSADSVTSLIKRLRTKLPKGAIKNIYGEGYKIVNYNEK
jgi:DNA-binding response OmpR family regulator